MHGENVIKILATFGVNSFLSNVSGMEIFGDPCSLVVADPLQIDCKMFSLQVEWRSLGQWSGTSFGDL